MKDFDNIVRYPKDAGCTGEAISNRQPVYFNKDAILPYFVESIDNISETPTVESLLIVPIFHSEKLFGVI